MYDSDELCKRDYQAGNVSAIVAVVDQLGIVHEERLDWRQIMDFRKDEEAKIKLRRMRHWFSTELADKPLPYIADVIAIRLDDYEWALRKHGIETATGSLAELLDMRFLPAVSAAGAALAVTAGPAWAAVGTTALIVGKATLSLSTRLLDLKERQRGKGAEIAFIHELKRMSAI